MKRVPVLVCRGLRRSFGDVTAVDGVDLEIRPGEAYGLVGPNGAGKTTTIRMVCGLARPDAGEVLVGGRSIARAPLAVKADIGYVPNDLALYTDLSGVENLRFWGRVYGLHGPRLDERTEAVLDLVGLQDKARVRAGEYSSGMQRRLNIAIALLHEPRLLVLDEPTVGIDPQSRTAILDRLASLRDGGLAILYTSHYMEEVERFCDIVGIIDHGRLIAEGRSADLVGMLGHGQRVRIDADGNLGAFASALYELPGVDEVKVVAGGVQLVIDEAAVSLGAVFTTAAAAGVEISRTEVAAPDLETVFLHLTGRELRD